MVYTPLRTTMKRNVKAKAVLVRMNTQERIGRKFRENKAAIKIQRAGRLMMGVAPLTKRSHSMNMMGVVLDSNAMRGGHIVGSDRTDRMLGRMNVHERRRSSAVDPAKARMTAMLQADEFDPTRYASEELAALMRVEHEQMHKLELSAWADMMDWHVDVDASAIERRLAILKPPRKEREGRRYLTQTQRPATAPASVGGSGARAARSLRPTRPSSAPVDAARETARFRAANARTRVVFRLAIAASRFAKGPNELDSPSFFITSGAGSAERAAGAA